MTKWTGDNKESSGQVVLRHGPRAQVLREKRELERAYVGWPVLPWLRQAEIITEHGQDVQTFINDQHGQIIIITVVVEGATGQHLRSKCQLAFHSQSLRVSLPLLLSLES